MIMCALFPVFDIPLSPVSADVYMHIFAYIGHEEGHLIRCPFVHYVGPKVACHHRAPAQDGTFLVNRARARRASAVLASRMERARAGPVWRRKGFKVFIHFNSEGSSLSPSFSQN